MSTRRDYIKNLEFPGILVAYEKHSTRFLKAGNIEELRQSALKLVKERMDPDYPWYYKPEPVMDNALSEKAIEMLPAGRVKDLAVQEAKQLKRDLAQYEIDLEAWNMVQECVKNNDEKLAFTILMNRRNGEYERVEFENLE